MSANCGWTCGIKGQCLKSSSLVDSRINGLKTSFPNGWGAGRRALIKTKHSIKKVHLSKIINGGNITI